MKKLMVDQKMWKGVHSTNKKIENTRHYTISIAWYEMDNLTHLHSMKGLFEKLKAFMKSFIILLW
jgi:hypothetical protein